MRTVTALRARSVLSPRRRLRRPQAKSGGELACAVKRGRVISFRPVGGPEVRTLLASTTRPFGAFPAGNEPTQVVLTGINGTPHLLSCVKPLQQLYDQAKLGTTVVVSD